MKTAILPMYSLPAMRAANARFWAAIRDRLAESGVDAPDALTFQSPPVPSEIGPDVLFTQTCGYPLQTIYQGQYRLLGRPCYDAPGCAGANHSAFLIVRRESVFERLEDLRGATFALNSRHSNSGFNLPRRLLAPLAREGRVFARVVETGSHAASIDLVTRGGADVASIDCVTHAFYTDHQPDAVAAVRVLAETPPSPSIPFVTAADADEKTLAALRGALRRVSDDPAQAATLRGLRLSSIEPADEADYAVLLRYEAEAAARG